MAKSPAALSAAARPADRKASRGREDSRRGDAPPARSAKEQSGVQQIEIEPEKRGRGRPKENRGTVVVTLRLPPDVVEAADAIIRQSGHVYRDRSEFFRQTISRAVTPRAALAYIEEHPSIAILYEKGKPFSIAFEMDGEPVLFRRRTLRRYGDKGYGEEE